jgi:tetratricopeptide (TPR) repeat protein
MNDVERLIVMRTAFEVLHGRQPLAVAAAEIAAAPLNAEDVASVRKVSNFVRQILPSESAHALVFATLNEVIASRSGDVDLQLLARFDLSNAYAEEGRWAEALPILDELHRDLADREVRGVPRVAVAGNRASIRAQLGDVEEAIAGLQEVVRLSEAGGRPADVGRWRFNLATIYEGAGRLDEAQEQYEQAARDFDAALADTSGQDSLQHMLLQATLAAGRAAVLRGQHADAVELLGRPAELSLALKDPSAACEALTMMARGFIGLGEAERAAFALAASLAIHVETGAGREPDWATRTFVSLQRSLGRSQEAAEKLEELIASAARFERYELQAGLLGELGGLYAADGDIGRAADAYDRASQTLERIGSADAARKCINEIAYLYLGHSDVDEGVAVLRRGLELAERAGDQDGATDQIRLTGEALAEAGRADEADSALSDALARARATSDLAAQVDVLASIGRLRLGGQRMVDAVAVLQQAAALAEALGDPPRTADVDLLLGNAMLYTGDVTGAARHLERAAAGFAALGQRATEALARSALTAAYSAVARGEDAIEQSRVAVELGRQLDEPLIVAEASAAQADAYLMQGRPGDALPLLIEATDIAQAHDRPELWARYLEGKANALRDLDRFDEAQRVYDEALGVSGRGGDADRAASITINLGVLLLRTGQVQEAEAGLTSGIAEARRLGNTWLLTIGLSNLAQAHWRSGRPGLARESLGEARLLAERQGYSELLWRQAVMGTRILDDAEQADVARAQADVADTIGGLTGAPGVGRRTDMLAQLAALADEFVKAGGVQSARSGQVLSQLARQLGVEYLAGDDVTEAEKGRAADPGPAWARDARRFVATGQRAFVQRAVAECDDERVRHVLDQLDEHEGDVPRDLWQPVVLELEARGAAVEALALNFVAAYPVLRAAALPALSAEADRMAAASCQDALTAATARGFDECRAAFNALLGIHALTHDQTGDALVYLLTSAKLFRPLAAAEPSVYRAAYADVLNRLGSLYGSTGNGASAQRIYRWAIAVLAPDGDAADADVPDLLSTWNNLGHQQADEHDLAGAAGTLQAALARYDALPDALRQKYATTGEALLHGIARVHAARRQFVAAESALERAMELIRATARQHGAPAAGELAYSLNLLGGVYAQQGQQAAAIQVFEEAVRLARSGPRVGSDRRTMITALVNLAGTAGEEGLFDRARTAYQEALDLQRPLADAQPDVEEPRLVQLLTNFGATLLNADDVQPALECLQEAVERGRVLQRRRPDSSRQLLVAALNLLASAQSATGSDAAATITAGAAVDLAEQGRTPADAWLLKGWAHDSYHRLLTQSVDAGDTAVSYAYLAALREPAVGATKTRPEHSLEAAQATLARLQATGGPHLRVVIGERLSGVDVLGVLDSAGLRLHLTTAVGPPALVLFDAVLSVFNAGDDETVDQPTLGSTAEAVVRALPGTVRDALTDTSATLLISGDPYWSTFPWEALRTGTGTDLQWLGMVQALSRMPALTAHAFEALQPRGADAGQRGPAAIVCPWDAVADAPLELARAEAEEVAGILTRRGYTLVPNGAPLMGQQANADGMQRALAQQPAILHYTGHADVVGGEEVLFLADPDGEGVPFGHDDLVRAETTEPARHPFARKPLVVLNGCHAARGRAFGGRQEDLLSTFLAEGAAAVVASAFPVDEIVGMVVGTQLYDGPEGEDLGTAVVRVRRTLAASDDAIARALWMLVTCHGNPLTPVA